jgi:hypothetical protein
LINLHLPGPPSRTDALVIPNSSYGTAPPFSITAIEDLKRAVRETPENGYNAVRLSRLSRTLEPPYVSVLFWDTTVDRHPGDQFSAERFLAAFKAEPQEGNSDFERLLRRFSDKFPSSSIPKECYGFLKASTCDTRASHDAADAFVVAHLRRFLSKSCLVALVEDEGEKLDSWRWEIWKRVFSATSMTDPAVFRVAQRIREGCVRRGHVGKFMHLWESLLHGSSWGSLQDFRELQLALCHLAFGESSDGGGKFQNLVDRWLSYRRVRRVHFLLVQEIGRTLALTKDFGFLASCLSGIPTSDERVWVLEGAKKLFEENGNGKGFIDWALNWPVGSLEEIRALLKDMSCC